MKCHAPPFLLRELKIELTHACGLNCIHCSSSASSKNTQNIDAKKCTQIIDEAAEIGVKKIAFSGGEPLLFEPIEAMVKHATRKHMEVTIYTSGYVEGFKKTIGNLHRVGLCKIIFSL